MNRFSQWVSSIADAGKELLSRGGTAKPDEQDSIASLCAELSTTKGEALGTAVAHGLVSEYNKLDQDGRLAFFQLLFDQYSVNPQKIADTADNYRQKNDLKSYNALRHAVEAPRVRLFRRMNMAPKGTATLIRMRKHLLGFLKQHPEFKAVDDDLRHLLISWFNRGFLTLEQISWNTPAHILEKLIAYEAVHAMDGWDDLRRRLEDDRRCFAFFHPALEDEPLIFVEVALVKGIASNVQVLLEKADPEQEKEEPDTAIFYSISNCQEGLKGISFGNFLIKQVVKEISRDNENITHFSTLSPIPGFRRWLGKEMENMSSELVTTEDREVLSLLEQSSWETKIESTSVLEPLLMRLCAHYLYHAKRGTGPLDPVANFHLGNGACMARLNWLGDTSVNGLKSSAGMLVNYIYELDQVEVNHEAFINEGKIATQAQFREWLAE